MGDHGAPGWVIGVCAAAARMNYNFSNLLGASYRGGSVILRGNELVSPVGNRIQVLDLSESLTSTLRFESNEQVRD